MFESRGQALLSRAAFAFRVLRSVALAVIVVAAALGVGVLGWHFLVGLSWLDALLNASMILSGMGPVDRIETDAGKWFASGYALFAGIVFLMIGAIVLSPLLHRFLHHFHMEAARHRVEEDFD